MARRPRSVCRSRWTVETPMATSAADSAESGHSGQLSGGQPAASTVGYSARRTCVGSVTTSLARSRKGRSASQPLQSGTRRSPHWTAHS
jgi:hypothetical protein